MIDLFAIGLSHGLILVAMWRIIFRPELDDESMAADKPVKPWLKNRQPQQEPQEPRADA
ncbi:hypothetical protein [Erythrobacter sp. EC-HK427]|uniref:hypothetical protein n=1 Tax=Erythrobacter sp. EC-HK427 TaxID=2038396 RepID=UPI001258C72D|nr:hypothetical protein [Erythrobacter sp. EC-HK427]VVT02078.1 conserved hypothetical protein [Erythrobacter sp. EC-HK427]